MKVVIIGGVAGGASAATRLRRLDETAEIIIFERDAYVSYANCGLPYHIGKIIKNEENLLINTPEELHKKFNLDVRIRQEVLAIHRDTKTVTVHNLEEDVTYEESYDKLILSPGSQCIHPRVPGAEGEKVFYFRNIPDMQQLKRFLEEKKPKSAVVAGAGFTGIELAENLIELGIRTTIVDKASHVFQALDDDVACDVHAFLRQKGVGLVLNNGFTEIIDHGDGVTMKLEDGEIDTDLIIMTVGMRPDNTLAKGCGLELTDRGVLVVDDHMRTSDEDIYAVGDAVMVKNVVTGLDDYLPLAGPANKQGRIAADNICGIDHVYTGSQGTSICKLFDLTVAWTGLNEKKASTLGMDFGKVYLWNNGHASFYPDNKHTSVKVLYENPTGRILGAQLVGFNSVDKRCDIFSVAIRAHMTAHDLAEMELAYAPPYAAPKETVNMVGFVIENILAGRIRMIYPENVQKFMEEKDPQIIDVRPVDAYMLEGYIEGSKSIPYEQFRKRAEKKLDKSRPVLVICNMGLNSYNCCRMLLQKGYDCYSLAGGYRLYASSVLGTWKTESTYTCGIPVEDPKD